MKPYYEHAGITIYHGDCREVITQLPKAWCSSCSCELADESIIAIHLAAQHAVGPCVDLLLTDPPYSFHSRGGGFHAGGAGNSNYQGGRTYIAELAALNCTEFGVAEFLDVAPCPYIVACCNSPLLHDYLAWGKGRGLLTDVHVWVKANPIPAKQNHFLHDLEYIAVMRPPGSHFRGDGPFSDYRKAFAGSNEECKLHPAEKPVGLMAKYLRVCLPDGGTVLDPYMGSGTTLRAAYELGRSAIGIEIEEKYCEIAAKRLSQEVFNFAQ